MGINLSIIKLKQVIVNGINESGLPPTVVSMILGEFKAQTDIIAGQMIADEQKAMEGDDKDGEEICKTQLAE